MALTAGSVEVHLQNVTTVTPIQPNCNPYKTQKVQLEAKYISREHLFDAKQRVIVDKMRSMIAASADALHSMRLFREVDQDESDGIDKAELEQLMRSLGIDLSDYRLRET